MPSSLYFLNIINNKNIIKMIRSQALRCMIINYLNERAKETPWWEKKHHDF